MIKIALNYILALYSLIPPLVLIGVFVKIFRSYKRKIKINPISAGNAWMYRILWLAVIPPKMPAISTQAKKKVVTFIPSAPSVNPQNNPAARKPLYKP